LLPVLVICQTGHSKVRTTAQNERQAKAVGVNNGNENKVLSLET
jgi:hypothetical protein